MAKPPAGIGGKLAPARFLVFLGLLAVGVGVGIPSFGLGRGTLVGFDVAAAIFLASIWPLLDAETADMRQRARANDANRTLLLAISAVVTLVVLVAVGNELKGKNDAITIALVIATLVLAWLFSNTVYALHYAHLWYSGDDDDAKQDAQGLDFPKTDEPDYWDFIYFSFTLGMTFQTSDVEMTDGTMRRVAIGQCLAAFVFNLGVLAFTINTIGGGH